LMCMERWKMNRYHKMLISIEYVPDSNLIYYNNYIHYSHYCILFLLNHTAINTLFWYIINLEYSHWNHGLAVGPSS
jgi:hypothetical protein